MTAYHPISSKTECVLQARFESVLLFFRLLIETYLQDALRAARRFSATVFAPLRQMRLALFANVFSNIRQQQDGKTLSLSKKGYIYMYTHAHACGGLVFKKCVLRLADALSSAMSRGGVTVRNHRTSGQVAGLASRP